MVKIIAKLFLSFGLACMVGFAEVDGISTGPRYSSGQSDGISSGYAPLSQQSDGIAYPASQALEEEVSYDGSGVVLHTFHNQPFTLAVDQRPAVIPFKRPHKVWEVIVAVTSENSQTAKGKVYLDNQFIGDVVAPGQDPQSVPIPVEGGKNARSIEIRTGQGVLRVLHVLARISRPDYQPAMPVPVCRPNAFNSPYKYPFPTHFNTAIGEAAYQATLLVDILFGFTDANGYVNFLLPIRKTARLALAAAEAQGRGGDGSWNARPRYEAFLAAMDAAQPWLENLMEQANADEMAQELINLREIVREILN